MLNNFIIMSLFIIIILMLFFINYLLTILKKNNRNKISPFECGFNPQSNSRLPFSNNFFLIMLMFLIFDVEIILIMPSILLIKYFNSMYFTFTLLMFLLILILSLMIEWMMNLLNWNF